MATLKTLVEQMNKMEAEVEKLKTENLSIKKQITTEETNKMICDKINSIVTVNYITNLYRNK